MYSPPPPFTFDRNGVMWPRTGLVVGECEQHYFPVFGASEGGSGGYWEPPPPRAAPPRPDPMPRPLQGLGDVIDLLESPLVALAGLAWLVWPRKRGRGFW